MLFPIYGVVCFKPAHSSRGDRGDIFVTQLIIVIKSEVSTIVVIFSVDVYLRCLYHHMMSVSYISGKGFFCYYFAVLRCTQIIEYILRNGRIRFHYTISSSPLCRRIWKYWTSIMFVRYILSSVCLRLSQFVQLSFIQYMGLCVYSLPISLVMIVWIRQLYLIIIKSEV